MTITSSYTDITTWFFDSMKRGLERQSMLTIGLAGGTSFDSWYENLLSTKNSQLKTLFPKIRWCVTDERVNCDITERNDEHIWQFFLKFLCEQGLSKEEYFIRPDMKDSGLEYTQKIEKIDIAFFGL